VTNSPGGVPLSATAPVPVTFVCADSADQPVSANIDFTIGVVAHAENRASLMLNPRRFHTATLMGDGSVLIAGGESDRPITSLYTPKYPTAEIFNPATAQLTATGRLTNARVRHAAVLLLSGRVLLSGGGNFDDPSIPADASAEIYDPATQAFAVTGPMLTGRFTHTASLLADGRVLVAGGFATLDHTRFASASAELYDPATGNFTATGGMNVARVWHAAVSLDDGRVLVLGGSDGSKTLASAELYDPATGVFTVTGSMGTPRYGHTGTKLRDGRVLVAGGYNGTTALASAEIYDPASAAFEPAASMGAARAFHTASPRGDGTVLILGGAHQQYQNPAGSTCVAAVDECWPANVWEPAETAEIFDPVSTSFFPDAGIHLALDSHTATTLQNGSVLVTGGEVISTTYVNGATTCCSYFESLVTTASIHLIH
jgi:hypothetical protein